MDNPFIPGARVALVVGGGYHVPTSYTEARVDKVYKTGRFTLVGSTQQWRPYPPGSFNDYWHASQTGDHGWSGGKTLRIWNDAANDDILASVAERKRYDEFVNLQRGIDRLRFSDRVTDEVLEHMRAAVAATLKES